MLSYDSVDCKTNFSQIEKTIVRAKKEWEAIFDALPDLVVLVNSEGRIARCNHAMIKAVRSTYGDLIGKEFLEYFPEAAAANAKGVELQLFAEKRWFRVFSFPVNLGAELVYHFYVFQDISYRKKMELDILREEQLFEALFLTLPESAAVIDSRGKILTVNPAFADLFGYALSEAAGYPLDTLLTAKEFLTDSPVSFQSAEDSARQFTLKCRHRDGSALMTMATGLPIRLNGIDHGRLILFKKAQSPSFWQGFSSTSTDAGHESLQILIDRMQPALKSFFEFADSLEASNLKPDQVVHLSIARENTRQLMSLLNEMQGISTSEPNPPHNTPVQKPEGSEEPIAGITKKSKSGFNHRRRRILVVEDNPINQKLMLRLLQKKGLAVQVAENGVEALKMVSKQDYDLIFMDVQMPEMDGLEATRRIRQHEGDGEHPIVIALTAEGPAGDRIECLKAGMDDFLAKPLDIDRLTLLLEKYLPDSLQEELPASRESDTETVSVEVPLSIEAALPRFGGDSEIYFDFLNHFIRQLKQTDAQMRAAYQNGDVSQLHSISHSLKGTAANFEANGICKAAGALEELTYNNTLVGAFTLINDISNEISALEAFCRNHTAPRKKTLISHPAGDGN